MVGGGWIRRLGGAFLGRGGAPLEEELGLCSLQLEDARASLASMDGGDEANRCVVLCGCPRSGTSLLSASLFQAPRMVTVMEPWEGLRLPPSDLFAWFRAEALRGRVPRTRLDMGALQGSGRVAWNQRPEDFPVQGADRSTLYGVKWPCFWQLLGASAHVKFLVCVRDPASVVASMGRQSGRLPLGLDYDVPFNRELNARLQGVGGGAQKCCIAHFDAVYEHALQFVGSRNVMWVRYERWFQDPSAQLSEISEFLGADLTLSPVRIEGAAEPMLTAGGSDAAAIRAMSATAARLGYDH